MISLHLYDILLNVPIICLEISSLFIHKNYPLFISTFMIAALLYFPSPCGLFRSVITCAYNRILRRIFGPKRNENAEWRILYNKELHSLYRSSNILRVIKSRRLRWAGHVARREESRSAFKILTSKPTAG